MTAVGFPFSSARQVIDLLCANYSTACRLVERGRLRVFQIELRRKVPQAPHDAVVRPVSKVFDLNAPHRKRPLASITEGEMES